MQTSADFKRRTEGCGVDIRHVVETDSTNREARAWAAYGAEDGSVVVADHQTAGRGRFQRTWTSAPGQNLLLTVILRRDVPRPALLPLAAGLAVRECVAFFVPARRVSLKWPNDVRVNRRKVAGILVESPEKGTYLVGIGLNVNQVDFPPDLASDPTSIMLEAGLRVDRAEVFDRLMTSLDNALELLSADSFLAGYRRHLEGVGTDVTLQDGRQGRLVDVDDSGGLAIETDTGRIVVHSGDVSLRSPHSS